MEKYDLIIDGLYKGPMTEAVLVRDDEDGLCLAIGEANVNDDDPRYPVETAEDILKVLLDEWPQVVAKHPRRVQRAIQEAVAEGVIEGDEIWDGKQEVWLIWNDKYDGLTAIIPESHLGEKDAWRDCRQGTTDHDNLHPIIDGDLKGGYLRETSSRYQGSCDYSCKILSREKAVKLAKSWGDEI